jgi:glycosyltransferase involved in cell wall biosynthesis
VLNKRLDPDTLVFGPEIWSAQSNGGISRYFVELSKNLALLGNSNLVLVSQHSNSQLPKIENTLELSHLKKNLRAIGKSSSTEKKIYHATYYSRSNLRIAKSLGFKTVLTVFDMIGEIFPERPPRFRFFRDTKSKSIRLADKIICISESTKHDLVKILGVDKKKIEVIHLASSFQDETSGGLETPRQNSILYVGKRSGYKNFKVLLQAFGASDSLRSNFSLVAFGGGGFDDEEEREIANLELCGTVIHASGDDSMLRELYLTSKVLVYPSLYEGFGLPLLEAMSLGCPVITANVSSMPEIGGDAALYFDPKDVRALQNLLEKTLVDEEMLESLSVRGLARSGEFSWRMTALKTLDLYNQL